MPPEVCPNCGADVPRNAKACPECGSDEKTGWSDEAHASGLDLPDDNFNYDEFVKKEFGRETKPHGIGWFWWIVAVVIILFFVFLFRR
ncbi:MAG TPA: zinc ribbon domain-containing protein [Verrucomicrobiae bacterium]|nr:zinc ribbon domain-containing protein [Verrucomicrobiae bacterium]